VETLPRLVSNQHVVNTIPLVKMVSVMLAQLALILLQINAPVNQKHVIQDKNFSKMEDVRIVLTIQGHNKTVQYVVQISVVVEKNFYKMEHVSSATNI